MSKFSRWLRFNAVGLLGIGVQVGTIAWLAGPMRMDYRLATILGVVAAVVHNFVWHWRWTWAAETRTRSPRNAFALFAAANGAMSLAGNVLGMSLLVGVFGVPTAPAVLLTIAGCGIGNFFAAEGIFAGPTGPSGPSADRRDQEDR